MFQTPVMTTGANGQARTAPSAAVVVEAPDAEVLARARRQTFSVAYKLRILTEADQSSQPGQIGSLLRREGLYSSHLTNWRRQRERGELGRKQRTQPGADPMVKEVAQLRQENARLQARLERAETIIEVQKKLSALLGLPCEAVSKADSR